MSSTEESDYFEYDSSTKIIHDGYAPESCSFMPVVPPIFLSTTFKQPELGKNQVI